MDARRSEFERPPGLLRHARDFLRWLGFLLLVSAAVGMFVLYLLQTRVDEQIRTHIENKFQQHYRGHLVSVRSARRLTRGGIEVRGLTIAERGEDGRPHVVAFVDELLVDCDTHLRDLVSPQRAVRQMVIRRLLLRPVRRADGHWNVSELLPLPAFGERAPPLRIDSAIVEIQDQSVQPAQQWVFRQIDLQATPEITESPDQPAVLRGYRLRGNLSNDLFVRGELGGHVDVLTGEWELAGSIKKLAVHPEAVERLPRALQARAELLRSLRGAADLQFQAEGVLSESGAAQLKVAGLYAGRVEDPRLPRPFRDVHATFRCDSSGFHLDRLAARTGDSTVVGDGFRKGWEEDSPLSLRVRAEHIVLDRSLRSTLQGEWLEQWERFAPEGVVDAEVRLHFDGQAWQHEAVVDCRDVSIAYAGFPYRLVETQGRIRCDNGHLRLEELRAFANRRVVLISGEMSPPGAAGTGWLEISVEEPVPIDESLIAALPDKGRQVIRDLQPHGMVTAWFRLDKPHPEQPPQRQMRLGLHDCSIRYTRFEYPVYGIHGTLTMRDDHWSFNDLAGVNDSGMILCQGSWIPDGQDGSLLQLDFDARDVPLEDELRDALQPEARQLWRSLRPRGTIDQLRVAVRYASRTDDLGLEVTAHKLPPGRNVEGRSISIQPVFLPYQLNQVVGSIRVTPGQIELSGLRGQHGQTVVKLDGLVDTTAPREWRVSLSQLHVDGLHASHELTSALPDSIGQVVQKLGVQGPVAVNGWLELTGQRGQAVPQASRWHLAFDLENGSIEGPVPLHHLHGGLTMQGTHGPEGVQARGWLQVDSMMMHGVQVTQVEGPFSLDSQRLALGQWSEPGEAQSMARSIHGKALGGSMAVAAQVWLDEMRYEIDATLDGGDLAIISQEATSRQHPITGRAFAMVRLHGNGNGLHTLRGQGQVQLRNADIYDLPVMFRSLKLLRIRPPDETAFTSSDVTFRIEADRIYFDRIDFDGDAISLEGRGEMTLDRVLNLTFDTFVGRDDDQPISLLVRPLLKEAGRRLMVLRVTGTLDDPHVERIALPDVNESFQQVFPGTSARPRDRLSRLPGAAR